MTVAPAGQVDYASALDPFLDPTRYWFNRTFGSPTPPQGQGWPAIQRGDHTLILAPTGSGKTLSAFLWGINQIFCHLLARDENPDNNVETKTTRRNRQSKNGSRGSNRELLLLYISPLKALNNDIERNLRTPLAGIRKAAEELGTPLPEIAVGVRSGDTPQRERQAMIRKPPHILITTPESLYLMLTSPKAREIFQSVRTVIVDEIHTLAGSKRGVHLSLSLERLQFIAEEPIQRIGLSATIRPLDAVARYLGGNQWVNEPSSTLQPRPVTIVDAAYEKHLDLKVETVVEDFHNLPGDSIWPSIIPRTVELIHDHQSTLLFVNNRRLAERTADRLNEQIAADQAGEGNALIEDGVAKGIGMMASGMGEAPPLIRAHHGSMSKEVRLALENDLKAGKLPALVGTSSLELGIDIGAIDLVIQYHSPKTVAEGLQRVGRSGHLVGQTSKGRIFPTHREDIMEAAAVAGGMLRGDVEPSHTPRNPLDILAQQIVAMVSVADWQVDELFALVRQTYAYQDLTQRAFHAVLDMLAGRYPSEVHRNLRARVVWDRVNNQLAALPGTRLLALTNGGAIPDRGSFGAYLSDGKTKLGELDEEFVYETRVGDTFMLGSQVWRVIDLTDDKVMVADAAGATPRMPFWRGDFAWRPYDLGTRVGKFRREVAGRLGQIVDKKGWSHYREVLRNAEEPAVRHLIQWLQTDYALDRNSACHVIDYVANQLDHAGAISSDKTILVEVFEDAIGDPRMVIQAPFGGRVNGLWALAVSGALREHTGVDVEIQTNDEGILLRFPEADTDFPIDLITEMTAAKARSYILQELPDSAVFGAQFRQNAARALLLPGLGVGKRTPFWLQRLRAKDLLQAVRQLDDFPIVAETYRDCLEEIMDLPGLETVLTGIERGEIEVVPVESINPSPVAHSLLWNFIEYYMYEWDAPKTERQLQTAALNRDLLQDILTDVDLSELLRPEAIAMVRDRLQRTAAETQARSLEELALLFQILGDLTSEEISQRTLADPSSWIGRLAGAERIVDMAIPTINGAESRWVHADYAATYGAAFDLSTGHKIGAEPVHISDHDKFPPALSKKERRDSASREILKRYLTHCGPVTQETILKRYGFPAGWLQQELDGLIEERSLARGQFTPTSGTEMQHGSPAQANTDMVEPPGPQEFVDRRVLEQMHRRTLTLLRQEIKPVPFISYVDFLTRWQHLHPETRLDGPGALHKVLQKLRAAPLVGLTLERDVLPGRMDRYRPGELAELCQSGDVVWVGAGGSNPQRGRIRFLYRGEGRAFLEDEPADLPKTSDEQLNASGQEPTSDISQNALVIYHFLQEEGSAFLSDICSALDIASDDAESSLIELAMAGLVTNDSLAILQNQPIKQGRSNAERPRTASSLEAQLAERLGDRRARRTGGMRRPGRHEMRAAKMRVQDRLARHANTGIPAADSGDASSTRPQQSSRWTLVHRFGVLGKELSAAEKVSRQVRQLLLRYGVVTRNCLQNESGAWEWSTLYQEMQRLEMRGEIRRGYFVQELPGIQFALPEVVNQLRQLQPSEITAGSDYSAQNGVSASSEGDSLVVLNACDPANVYNLVDLAQSDVMPLGTSGQPLRFSRVPTTWLVLARGFPVLLVEDTGGNITTVKGVDDVLLGRAVRAWLGHAGSFMSKISVKTWNDEPVLNSNGQAILEDLGFYRDYPAMTL